jgi:glycerol-3-phosphate dehydrogenase subunit B
MKSDVLVVGAELDGLLAALSLARRGRSVRIVANGAGSLHYAPGGLHLLGYGPDDDQSSLASPWEHMSGLPELHPYRLLGEDRVRAALDWFLATSGSAGGNFGSNGENVEVVTPAGLAIPVFGVARHQATLPRLHGRKIAVVRFEGHRDFPADLLGSELSCRGVPARPVTVAGPGCVPETVALARAFDSLEQPDAYFKELRSAVPRDAEVLLFPAVLGLDCYDRIAESAERSLGLPCLEVATLPPSVPGMRLQRALLAALDETGVVSHVGASILSARDDGVRYVAVSDDMGRSYEASAFIVATGGVLMGGLEVDSRGVVRETAFGLDVFQTAPISAEAVVDSLSALHETGVTTDGSLRPSFNSGITWENVFVTGRTLGHWNPSREGSAEGVSIATGWAAAEAVHGYLGD